MKCIKCSGSIDSKDELVSYFVYSLVGGNISWKASYPAGSAGQKSFFTPLRKYSIFTSICNNCVYKVESKRQSDEKEALAADRKNVKKYGIIFSISLVVAILCIILNLKWFTYIVPIAVAVISGFGTLFNLPSKWDILSKEEIRKKLVFEGKRLAPFFKYIFDNESDEDIIFNVGWDCDFPISIDKLVVNADDLNSFNEWKSCQKNRHWYFPTGVVYGYQSDGKKTTFSNWYGPFSHIHKGSGEVCEFSDNKYIKNAIGLIQDDNGIHECDSEILDKKTLD